MNTITLPTEESIANVNVVVMGVIHYWFDTIETLIIYPDKCVVRGIDPHDHNDGFFWNKNVDAPTEWEGLKQKCQKFPGWTEVVKDGIYFGWTKIHPKLTGHLVMDGMMIRSEFKWMRE